MIYPLSFFIVYVQSSCLYLFLFMVMFESKYLDKERGFLPRLDETLSCCSQLIVKILCLPSTLRLHWTAMWMRETCSCLHRKRDRKAFCFTCLVWFVWLFVFEQTMSVLRCELEMQREILKKDVSLVGKI